MNKAVYKFHVDCGRQGDLQGVFVANPDHVVKLIESKIEVYFGEVLGKHSEIYGSVESNNIALVSSDPEVVKIFEEHDLSSGLNPFHCCSINFEVEGEDLEDMCVEDVIETFLLKNQ